MRTPMKSVRIVIDSALLRAADKAAGRTKQSRSELVRDALREHLRRIEIRAKEEREGEAYRKQPQTADEMNAWEGAAAWPAFHSSGSR